MAPKRAKKLVVTSTRKVVRQHVQVSVVGSAKRSTRANRDTQTPEEAVNLDQDNVRTIPVQELTPKASENEKQTHGEQKEDVSEKKAETTQKEGQTVNEEKIGKRKRGKKRRSEEGYQRYVYRVLKQVHPDLGVSSKAMTVLNNMMSDMFERLADEAARLKKYAGHVTLSSREIQGAVKLVLPGDLGKHAISEGVKAVTNYMSKDE